MVSRSILWISYLLCIYMLLVSHENDAAEAVHKKLSSEEIAKLVSNAENPQQRYSSPENFNEEEGLAAKERLIAEKKRLESAQQRAAGALERWEQLSLEEKAEILKVAAERAAKARENIIRDMDLSKKLLQKEAADLEDELDRKIHKQRETERKAEEAEFQKEKEAFDQVKQQHQNKQFTERTTEKALMFWIGTFIIGVVLTRILLTRGTA